MRLFNKEVVEKEIEEVNSQIDIYQAALVGLKVRHIHCCTYEYNLQPGDKITFRHSNGDMTGSYLGIRVLSNQVFVRVWFNKKNGKPRKKPENLDWSDMQYIEKYEVEKCECVKVNK